MHKIFSKFIKVLFLISICTFSFADLSSSINHLIQEQNPNEKIGVYIQNLQTDEVLYSHNGNVPMTPASTTKAFTAAAAYLSLGPNYHYATTLSTDGRISAGVLKGNVYIHFSGDPTLSSIDLDSLIHQMRYRGIRHIEGNVVLDETVFSGPVYGMGWGATDTSNCYGAPITGAIINSDCSRYGVVRSPNLYAQQITHFAVRNAGIRLTGSVVEGKTPAHTETLAVHYSSSLQDILNYMLKYSDDVYANAIFKTMGKNYFDTGSYKDGALATHAILVKHFGSLFSSPVLKDGSGLSTDNLISPAQLVALYRYMYKDARLRQPFMHSLAISGQSGTLVFRLTEPGLRDHVFAKTGTFERDKGGVSNLAGYLVQAGRPPIAFAIMTNDNDSDARRAEGLQDQIVRLISENQN